jgi:hypothetical protein
MSDWRSISRDDLLRWADQEGAAQRLPQLVRRLILETGDGVEVIDIAEGRGVMSGGLDGFVRAARSTSHVPVGVSVWELSVEKDLTKADRDYEKRHSVPDGSATAGATYTQVITRHWQKRTRWAADRTAEGRWHEVRGFNVDALATWIEQAPGTRVWFAEQLGLPVTGLWSATEWWERWAGATEPALTPELVLARPEAPIEVLRTELARPGVTTVGGALGLDELLAVVIASAFTADERVVAPLLVVTDRDAWQRLLEEPTPLILAAADSALAQDVDPSTKHSVIVPISHATEADVLVEPIDAEKLSALLREAGVDAVFELSPLAHRSFVAFRRRLARKRELMRPSWAAARPPQAVRTAMLLTAWNDRNAADRAIVESCTAASYNAARDALLPYTAGDDPLFALSGDRWHVVSPVDAMTQLGPHLLRDDLELFVKAAEAVLAEVDPSFDLPVGERWRASIYDKRLAHSHQLRSGVANGLAVLGTYGDLVAKGTGAHGEEWAGVVLYRVLSAANNDATGQRWASVSGLLPLLAEASPRVFLDAVRDDLGRGSPVLLSMFQDSEQADAFSSSSPHTGLLWALENLAWAPQFFTETVQLLATLAELDPGGRLSNRPQSSLDGVFCSWHPDTAASAEQRLDALNLLSARHPAIAWRVLLGLLPERMSASHFPTHAPEYRPWKPVQEPMLLVDYWAFIGLVVERLLALVGDDTVGWRELLDAHDGLTAELRSNVCAALGAVGWAEVPTTEQTTLWQAIRDLAAKHREYADAQWALSEAEVSEIEEAVASLAPTDPALKHAWLFSGGWITLGDLRRRDDHQAYETELASQRAAAIAEIEAEGSLEAVAKFCDGLQQSHSQFVGPALADAVSDRYLDELLSHVEADAAPSTRDLARSYVWKLCRDRGFDWVATVLDDRPGLSPSQRALLLNYADDFERGREIAAQLGDDVEAEYWRNFSYIGRGDFPHALEVAEKLIEVGRLAGALDLLGLYLKDNDSSAEYAEAIATALEAVISTEAPDPSLQQLRQWDFERLFGCLEANSEELGTDRVTRIEWYFFPVLGYQPKTTHLHERLARDPAFFGELISLVYRARSDAERGDAEQPELDEAANALAENAWRLLHSWKVPPGTPRLGDFDVNACEHWIMQARELLEASDRLEVGEQHIGNALTYTPQDDDGTWPSEAVRNLIERLDSRQIERGFEIEMVNRRGVTSRDPLEGGDQERAVAREHRARADRFKTRWPRTAAIFSRLADDFENQGRRYDADAEQRRRGFDQ